VVAVGREEVVVVAEQAHGADAHRFLADVQVEETADLPLDVHLLAALLEPADEQHLPVQNEGFVSIHGLAGLQGAVNVHGQSIIIAARRRESTKRGHAVS
jgi:hypothetical protein